MLTPSSNRTLHGHMAALALECAMIACAPDGSTPNGPGSTGLPPAPAVSCALPRAYLHDGGVGRDGIPSLVNPPLVTPESPEARYLLEYESLRNEVPEFPDLRVVGLIVEGTPVAVPHNILWWHEIVNLDVGTRRVAVTYCPLTGSALVFDASAVPTERFGVSGLLFKNNLMMFDPETGSLWPQMMAGAACGSRAGMSLPTVPHAEMRWAAWLALHPDTRVVSSATGWARDYARYPYDLYESASFLLFPMDGLADARRPDKERVLGLPDRDGGVAFPFGLLAEQGAVAVVEQVAVGRSIVVLWDGAAQSAQAFERRSETGTASLTVTTGRIVDRETGSRWTVDGWAVTGPRVGERLVPVVEAHAAFWLAWVAFQPATRVWQPSSVALSVPEPLATFPPWGPGSSVGRATDF